jgi:hypothetical protein
MSRSQKHLTGDVCFDGGKKTRFAVPTATNLSRTPKYTPSPRESEEPPRQTALRQAWELDDAEKAERLLRNLARRLEQDAPGVARINECCRLSQNRIVMVNP